MNMQSKITHTAAEEALLSALNSVAGDQAQNALLIISQEGLPTRRIEAWHYTDLRSLLRDYPSVATAKQSVISSKEIAAFSYIVEGYNIAFADVFPVENSGQRPPAGVDVRIGIEKTLPDDTPDDTIAMLNRALAETGATISIAANTKVDEALILAHTCSGGTSSALRHLVNAGEAASALIIERHHCGADANHQNIVTDLNIGKGAKVTWAIFQELGIATTRLAQLNVKLGEDAELTILVLNAGGRLVRQEINVEVEGENSKIAIKGVNLIGEGAHIDVTTNLAHTVPHTTATEIFRNVVTGDGQGVFQGQIRVGQLAQKTDAKMTCNTLLLSDKGDFSAKPELEIFADDVVCGHGATVTDIDGNHLFYLRSRGIRERDARALLVKAFVEEIFEDLEIGPHGEALGNAFNTRIESWLDTHA